MTPATCSRCAHTRRDFVKLALGAAATAAFGPLWSPLLAQDPSRAQAVILLFLQGAPSQIDTFDPKPGTETGGSFKAIDTRIDGARFCEHLPRLAKARPLSLVRTLHSKDP